MVEIIRIEDYREKRKSPRGIGDNGGPTLEIELPTLHADQVKAYRMPARFKAVRCGRRWGKTKFGETVACDAAIRGQYIGWFSPEYKFQSEAYADIVGLLAPVLWSSSKMDGVIRTTTKGRLDFWSLDNPNAGRSRRYHGVVIDEAAFAKGNMTDIWRKAIRPTLVDFRGWALVLSNTNGMDATNWFYQICNDAELGFKEYHAPTSANPYMPTDELEEIKAKTHPLVYEQEYLSEFVDWSGAAFFAQPSFLDGNSRPYPFPRVCDAVFATIDTADKNKKQHDGTAVIYWARSQFSGIPLMMLDYNLIQIEGAMLENWLPSVFERLNELAKLCGARRGSLGAWIEDKHSGTILLQQARNRRWAATPIDPKLTNLGKDARALNVSGYVHRGSVKISEWAYKLHTTYKGVTRNHLLGQIVGFRIGVDNGEDDLADCFTYGVALALGNQAGF
jgi:hypothetical protein